jgi:lipoteichoic acid synthase
MRGQLCSLFPAYHYNDWKKAKTKLKTSPLLCMPHVLGARGYESIYLSHGSPDVVYTGAQFLDFGFDSLYWTDDILKLLGEEPAARGEPDDPQMFRATRKFLEERTSDRPFFLAMSTIETHVGRNVASGEKKFRRGHSRVLNVFHRMDKHFGDFWRWFKQSKYAENTIVVVTGDHTQPPNKYMRLVAEPWYLNTQFSYMGLFIYDPFHKLPDAMKINTSSIDFAPSILQLMGVKNQPNPFLGLSMFSDRKDKEGGVGLIYAKRYFYWKDGKPIIKIFGCKKKDNCPAYNAAVYLAYLDRSGRIWSR